MSSLRVDINQTLLYPLGQTSKTLESLPQRLSAGKKVHAPEEDPTLGEKVNKGGSAYHRFQAINARLNRVAMNVRVIDQIMDTIGRYLEEMKAQLERIIKNFPPFPPGSEERVKILRSCNALRKQIDQMTFSLKNQGAIKVPANPTMVTETKDSKDLSIPKLSETATDQEIAAAIESLNAAKQAFQESRAGVAAEAFGISSSEVVKSKWVELDRNGEEVESDLSEKAAELKSEELRHTLSAESTTSLTEAQSSLVSLLE